MNHSYFAREKWVFSVFSPSIECLQTDSSHESLTLSVICQSCSAPGGNCNSVGWSSMTEFQSEHFLHSDARQKIAWQNDIWKKILLTFPHPASLPFPIGNPIPAHNTCTAHKRRYCIAQRTQSQQPTKIPKQFETKPKGITKEVKQQWQQQQQQLRN